DAARPDASKSDESNELHRPPSSGVVSLVPPASVTSRPDPSPDCYPDRYPPDARRLPDPSPDLAEVAAAWPTLPEPIKATILALVRGASIAPSSSAGGVGSCPPPVRRGGPTR